MNQLMTSQQVAKRLNMKSHTLAVWRCSGRGPKFLKDGHWVRYREQDVDEWLEQKSQ